MKMPPIGIEPRYLWEERRMVHLLAAIRRYQAEECLVPWEWVKEYNELRERALEREATTRTSGR